ncbi:hypothetical protein F5887DRAFT_922864 [Amanita rubescens]|nr:hypothetical protein F5887DRAFT_922864 [Amanita rubescens]
MLSQPERDQIVQYFFDLPLLQRSKTNHFNFNLPEWPALFVKYGDKDLLAEASTQYYFHALAQEVNSAPGIPAVYSAFRGGNGYYFIVMEKIDLPTLGACNSIRDDYAMPAVPGSLFGRISASEACVWHSFKRRQAPVPFVSPEAVAKHVNKALSRCRRNVMLHLALSASPLGDALLSVENLAVQYAPDLPAVLPGLSFTLKSGERVGVLGRTGLSPLWSASSHLNVRREREVDAGHELVAFWSFPQLYLRQSSIIILD